VSVPLFVELCAGSAAVTLRLIGGPNARPPISYMGSKRGLAHAIGAVLGLRSGQGADAVVLVEAGPWAKAWRLLTTPEGCRAVADVIRGWVGEDARALWDRLRAEPVPDGEAEAVGAWMVSESWTLHGADFSGPFARKPRPSNPNSAGAMTLGGFVDRAAALSALSWPPVQVVEGDVCGVEASPEAVAKWLYLRGNEAMGGGFAAQTSGWHGERGDFGAKRPPESFLADSVPWGSGSLPSLADLTWPPTIVSNADVSTVEPGTLPEGTVCYMDPPYANTTGYQAKLPREKVLEVAQRWADAGATVCVSEAEPLPLPGWHHVEITECRVGQRRTFSKQKREWLTLNRAPAWVPGKQGDLF